MRRAAFKGAAWTNVVEIGDEATGATLQLFLVSLGPALARNFFWSDERVRPCLGFEEAH
jgi:hypothetical protein